MAAEKVALESEIEEGRMRLVVCAERQIVLCRIDGEIHAFDGVCPHRGALLGQGVIEGSTVTCPWHAWKFDVKTGACTTNPHAAFKKYEVVVANGEVAVR